jgi:hypothetical protein
MTKYDPTQTARSTWETLHSPKNHLTINIVTTADKQTWINVYRETSPGSEIWTETGMHPLQAKKGE